MILGIIKNGEKELLVGGAAANVSYNNGNSGLTATDVQGAVDELNAEINRGSISVTGTGTETLSQALSTLFSLVDMSKVSEKTKLVRYTSSYKLVASIAQIKSNELDFYLFMGDAGGSTEQIYNVKATSQVVQIAIAPGGNTVTDISTAGIGTATIAIVY